MTLGTLAVRPVPSMTHRVAPQHGLLCRPRKERDGERGNLPNRPTTSGLTGTRLFQPAR
jgi:hypothetical protein